jgi:hypothetical protein
LSREALLAHRKTWDFSTNISAALDSGTPLSWYPLFSISLLLLLDLYATEPSYRDQDHDKKDAQGDG